LFNLVRVFSCITQLSYTSYIPPSRLHRPPSSY